MIVKEVSMGKLKYSTTIAIDPRRSTIDCFSMVGNNMSKVEHRIKNYAGTMQDEGFFARFKEAVGEFVAETPSESVRRISLILPDNAVALDTVNVPTMRNRAVTKGALNLTLGEIYANFGELKVLSHVAAQNRQYTTFSTAAVQKRLLTSLYSACSENKVLVENTTFAASSAAGAVAVLNPKLKNATYLLLDIKDTYARFVFIAKGRAVGFYHLPFGMEFLGGYKYVQEDMLFDHTMAELTVINAREKAKSKRLTVLADEADKSAEIGLTEEASTEEPSSEGNGQSANVENMEREIEDNGEEELTSGIAELFTMTPGHRIATPKIMAKKTPRRLPKFMQRPIPETEEEIACENFRVFVKWTLSLIGSNEKITQLGKPEFVCVNLPPYMHFVLDKANEELEENGIEFRNLGGGTYNQTVLDNLELYGGFFPKAIHSANKF